MAIAITEADNWQTTVRQWLEANERSQAWLAQKSRLSTSWFCRCMRGKIRPSQASLDAIGKVMGLEPGTLRRESGRGTA